MRNLCFGLGLIVVSALVASGCGGGDDSALTKQEFVQQANKICQKANEKTAGEIEKAFEAPEFANAKSEGEGIRAEVTQLVPILIKEAEAQSGRISGLEGPDELDSEIQSTLGAYKAWIKKAEKSPLKIVIANDIYNKARELAAKAGLEKCQQTPFQVI